MTILYKEWKENKAQFKRTSFHVPNLIPPIKYMKRSMFESIKSDMSNLGRQMNGDRRLWRDFVSNVEPPMWGGGGGGGGGGRDFVTNVEHHLCPPPPRPGSYSLEFLGVCRPGPSSWKDD